MSDLRVTIAHGGHTFRAKGDAEQVAKLYHDFLQVMGRAGTPTVPADTAPIVMLPPVLDFVSPALPKAVLRRCPACAQQHRQVVCPYCTESRTA